MDSYLVEEKEAVQLALFLVNMGRIDKITLISQAEKGNIPSGFSDSQGPIRVSWLKHKEIADAILLEVKELEKETKENVGKVEAPAPVKKSYDYFNKKKKKK